MRLPSGWPVRSAPWWVLRGRFTALRVHHGLAARQAVSGGSSGTSGWGAVGDEA